MPSSCNQSSTIRWHEDKLLYAKMRLWSIWAGNSQNDFVLNTVRVAVKQHEKDYPEHAKMINEMVHMI